MKVLLTLLRKEFIQFFRNPIFPKMAFAFPFMVMLVVPLVATMDVKHVSVSVVDHDNSQISRHIIQKFYTSEYFTLHDVTYTYSSAISELEHGNIDVIVSIPADFGESVTLGSPKTVSIDANGINSIKGSLGSSYASQIVTSSIAELQAKVYPMTSGTKIATVNLFNPTLDYRFYMIPALLVMLMIMLCGFLPALNMVSEKEKGTIQQINVSPIGRFTFIFSKLIPYWIIGLIVVTAAITVGYLAYGLWPAGNLGALYLACIIFILAMSGFGLIVANYSDNLQQTMLVMFFFIMVSILLSGLFTPIDSMPRWAQIITYALPPRYFIDSMRAIYLRGTLLIDLQFNFFMLMGLATLLGSFAIITYRKQS